MVGLKKDIWIEMFGYKFWVWELKDGMDVWGVS